MAPEMTRFFFVCVQFPRSELQDVSSGDVRRHGRDVWNSRTVLWTGITTVHGHELLPVSTLFSNSVCVRRSSRQHELWKARLLRKDVEQSSRSSSLERYREE